MKSFIFRVTGHRRQEDDEDLGALVLTDLVRPPVESFSVSIKDSAKHGNSAGDMHKYEDVAAKALIRHAATMNNHHKTNEFESDVNSTHIIAKEVRDYLIYSTALMRLP